MAINFTKVRQQLEQLKHSPWKMKEQIELFLQEQNIQYCYIDSCTIKLVGYRVEIALCYVDRHYCGGDLYRYSGQFYDKAIEYIEQNIRLIYIWDWEWQDLRKRKIFKNIILYACKRLVTKIYARNTYIKAVSARSIRNFFEENNMQGYRNANDAVCLFDKTDDELLMAYSIGHAYFGKGKYDLEIARGACKLGICVPGGASKLWHYITTQHAPNKSIVYYVDLNTYNGLSLHQLTKLSNNTHFIGGKKSFRNWFIDEQVMRNRDPKHHQLIKEKTELGLVRTCYNAGSLVYVYQPKV